MSARCEQELCPNWAGDDGCPCRVLGIERPEPAEPEPSVRLSRSEALSVGIVLTQCVMPNDTDHHRAKRRELAERLVHDAVRAEPEPADPESQRPEVVVLCGSTRFYDAFQRANFEQTMAGRIVLSVGFYAGSPDRMAQEHGEGVGITPDEKDALDDLHKRKIDLADRVLVLNVGGYIGESTRSEIDYALAHGKPVDYLEPSTGPAEPEPRSKSEARRIAVQHGPVDHQEPGVVLTREEAAAVAIVLNQCSVPFDSDEARTRRLTLAKRLVRDLSTGPAASGPERDDSADAAWGPWSP